jgi:DNA-directed RNA polymerase specialized sigma24 family protein
MSVRREDIEEVINDTFWVVWTKAGEFRGASQLSTWIIGIAYRRRMNALAPRKDPPGSDEPFDEDSISVRIHRDAANRCRMACAWTLALAGRAAHGARAHLHPRPFLRGSCGDSRLPGQYGEDTAVPRARNSQTSVTPSRGLSGENKS